jgi:hypothetical protein
MSTISYRAARVSKRFLTAAFALYYNILISSPPATNFLWGRLETCRRLPTGALSTRLNAQATVVPRDVWLPLRGAGFSSCGPDFIRSSRLQAGLCGQDYPAWNE